MVEEIVMDLDLVIIAVWAYRLTSGTGTYILYYTDNGFRNCNEAIAHLSTMKHWVKS